MKIIFFGTSAFAARVLDFLLEKSQEICAVVTRPDRPRGRSLQLSYSPVKQHALGLPVHQPEKVSTPEFAEILKSYQADLFIVVAFGEIIKKNILDIPRLGCVNIHASLLPKYRGAAPIQRCLMDGERETGITIIDMVLQMDAGAMLRVAKTPISEEMTFGELEEKLCELACETILQTIQDFQWGCVTRTPQDPSQATLAPKITPEDEEIRWDRSARELHNQIRALAPFPGAWVSLTIGTDKKRLKIKRSAVVQGLSGAPGEILKFGKEGWIVACGQEALALLEVQLEGKRLMKSEEFVKGYVRTNLKF